ncbi:MAG: molecular chaperone DnaJ, partial [Pseudomonadota bacterium]|nr:molecular chaperone DnaJ [Pseudomonadota bacterium]
MANVNSKFFDGIKISKKQESKKSEDNCQWEDCEMPAVHKAPKGRGMEGQYYNFCLKHVREYNKNYNYFEGMNQTDLSKFQKEAMLGDRPTWKLGVDNKDQLGSFSAEEILKKLKANRTGINQDSEKLNYNSQKRQKIGNAAKKALYVLGLDNTSSSDEIKNRYKL